MIWDVSRFQALDFETHTIQDGLAAPPLVVGSTAWWGPGGASGRLLHPAGDAYEYAKALLNSDRIVVGANIAYDMVDLCAEGQRRGDPTAMDAVVCAYSERRVFDVLIASDLEAIFDGSFGNEKDNDVSYPSWDRRAGQKVKKPSGKIAKRFGLEVCADVVLGRVDAKRNDFWRLRYAILEHIPLDYWPADAKQYPVDDAVNTLEVAAAQVLGYQKSVFVPSADGTSVSYDYTPPHHNLDDMADQAETAFWEAMGAAWGIRADCDRVEALTAKCDEMHGRVVEQFARHGLYHVGGPLCPCGVLPCGKGGKPWVQAIKRRVAVAYGADPASRCPACGGCGRVAGSSGSAVFCDRCDGTALDLAVADRIPLTPREGVSKDRDALMESGDEVLAALGDNVVEKVRDTYLPYVRGGVDVPITLRPNVLLSSGRSSYDGLIQLFMRQPLMEHGKPIMFRGLPLGVRQCLAARVLYWFFSIDYSAIELCALAQVTYWLFGKSTMRDVINETKDPGFLHSIVAARMIGISDDEMRARLKAKDKTAKDNRQAAKCFHPDVEVLTRRRGWIRIADLTMEDEVASATPSSPPIEGGRVITSCRNCGKTFGVKTCEVRDGGGKYCSHPCRAAARASGAYLNHVGPDLGSHYSGDLPSVRIDWVKPTLITKRRADRLVRLHNQSIDLRVTPDHRMLVYGMTNKIKVVPAVELNQQRGWFNAGMGPGSVDVDERMLRLAVATQADGNCIVSGQVQKHIRFGFVKERKIVRMMALLRPGEYTTSVSQTLSQPNPVTNFKLSEVLSSAIKSYLDPEKKFPWWWVELSSHLREVLLEEACYWDAHVGETMADGTYWYHSTEQQNIDVLQAVAAITNCKTRRGDGVMREGRWYGNHWIEATKPCYNLTLRRKYDSRGDNVAVEDIPYDGDVYCLSVPSSFVVVRDGQIPVITGQCFSFGVPGGMGGAKIVLTNRKAAAGETVSPDGVRYAGIRFCVLVGGERRCGERKVSEWKRRPIVPTCQRCLEVAEYQLRPTFLNAYPEIAEYLAWSNSESSRDDEWSSRVYNLVPASVRPGTELSGMGLGYTRIRGGVDYCARANGGFQQLNADGTKAAVRAFGRECYGYGPMGRESPLYGTRPIMMVHDEIFGETPRAGAHAAVMHGSEVMKAEMRRYVPDVYIDAPPALAGFWSKDMEKRLDENGVIVPWDLEAIAEDARAKGLTP